MFVPLLEEDHALDNAFVDHVVTYPEYPGERHPMEHLKDILKDLKLANKVIGLDARGYGSPMGYEGPAVEEVFAAKDYVLIPKLVEKIDRKSTRLNSSHVAISYAVFCLKKKIYKV